MDGNDVVHVVALMREQSLSYAEVIQRAPYLAYINRRRC